MTVAFVQAASAISATVTVANIVTGSITVGSGHTIVIGWHVQGSQTFGSLASSQGDSIIAAGATQNSAGTTTYGAHIITSAIGGATTFTLNCAGGTTQLAMGVHEYSGCAGNPVEQYAGTFGTSFVQNHTGGTTNGGPAPAGALQAGDGIFAFCTDEVSPASAETFSSFAAGFTIPAAGTQLGSAGTGGPPCFTAYQVNVAAGSYLLTYNTARFVQSTGIILGLLAAGAARSGGGGNLDGGLNGGFL